MHRATNKRMWQVAWRQKENERKSDNKSAPFRWIKEIRDKEGMKQQRSYLQEAKWVKNKERQKERKTKIFSPPFYSSANCVRAGSSSSKRWKRVNCRPIHFATKKKEKQKRKDFAADLVVQIETVKKKKKNFPIVH